jgi:hypothetical protein
MGSYRVPNWKKSIGQSDTTFTLTMDDGTEYILPKGEWLPVEHVELMDNVRMLGATNVLNEIVPPIPPDVDDDGMEVPGTGRPGLGDAFRKVPQKFLTEFITSWQKDAQVEPGESEAS